MVILEDMQDAIFKEMLEDLADDSAMEFARCIYGLVQAGREWYKKIAGILEDKLNFRRSKKDPCLFYKNDPMFGELVICFYVDDCGIIGEEPAMQDLETQLKKYFTVTVTDMNEYIGCTYVKTLKGLLVHQPRLLKRMREKFGDKVSNLKKTETPLRAGYVTKNLEEGEELNPNEQTEYQSGVAMNIYLVKQSLPDLGNATRELSKQMQKDDPEQRDGLLRLIKFALDTEGEKLVIEPTPLNETKGMWFIKSLCDCGFATDESRKSVTGFMVYFCDVLVAWKSKMQKNLTISTTEG